MTERTRFCWNCKHACLGRYDQELADDGEHVFDRYNLLLQCRRRPPETVARTTGGREVNAGYPYHGEQYHYRERTEVVTSFPEVSLDMWCGEWGERA